MIKFVKYLVFSFLILFFFSCQKKEPETSPEIKASELIKDFSKRVQQETGLILFCLGVNNHLSKAYELKNGLVDFTAHYRLPKKRQDCVSIQEARRLIISLTEGLINEINTNQKIRPYLDIYPVSYRDIYTIIFFEDEHRVDLGQGVAEVHYREGKIQYEKYDIYEYRNRFPARGKNFTILEESYVDNLEKTKKEGKLTYF